MKKFLKKMKKNEKGFTLIELIVVIAIIAVLAAIMVPRFANFSQKAADSAATQEATSLAKLVAMYEAGEGSYPKAPGQTGSPFTYTGNSTTAADLIFDSTDYGRLVIDSVTGFTIDSTNGMTYSVGKEGQTVAVTISIDGEVTP